MLFQINYYFWVQITTNMEKLTSVKITTAAVNKAKQIKKKTGVSIGKQFELAFAYYNNRFNEIKTN